MNEDEVVDEAVTSGSIGSSDLLLIAERGDNGTKTAVHVRTGSRDHAQLLESQLRTLIAASGLTGVRIEAECISLPAPWVVEARFDALLWRLGIIDERGERIHD